LHVGLHVQSKNSKT